MKLQLRKSLPLMLGMALIGAAPMAVAQDASAPPDSKAKADAATFATLDLDQNGYIGEAEVASDTTLSAYFANYDKDADGQLSAAEYQTYVSNTTRTHKDEQMDHDAMDPTMDHSDMDKKKIDPTDTETGDY